VDVLGRRLPTAVERPRRGVQIGALKLRDDETLTETDTLDVLVTPSIDPDLSDYFIQFNGIT